MVRQHHRLNVHELEQTPGDGKGQESLACGSPWGYKDSDTTQQLKNKVTQRFKHHDKNMVAVQSKSESESESCIQLSDPMGCTWTVLQAGILEWVAFPFAKGSSQLRD